MKDIGKHELISNHDISNLDGYRPHKHRAGVHERVEFAVLSAGVDGFWQVPQEAFVE